jgi:hypothetical protein
METMIAGLAAVEGSGKIATQALLFLGGAHGSF